MLKCLKTQDIVKNIVYKEFVSYFCMKFVRKRFCFLNGLASHTRDVHRNTTRTLLKIICTAVRSNENFKFLGHCP
jgi:hypothetical protein